jgi:hypothetical protein
LRWQRLLSRGVLSLLEDQQLRGLCAELDFLHSEAIAAVGLRAGVAAWHGPRDAPKDFVFDFAEVEIKAVHQQPREYCISSLEQLTDVGKPLFLWTRVVDLGSVREADTRSVLSLIQRIRAVVAPDATAAEELEGRLRLAGYEDRPEYGLRVVNFGPISCFRVTAGFPRLERSDVAAGISSCQYRIQAPALEPFRVRTWRGGHH